MSNRQIAAAARTTNERAPQMRVWCYRVISRVSCYMDRCVVYIYIYIKSVNEQTVNSWSCNQPEIDFCWRWEIFFYTETFNIFFLLLLLLLLASLSSYYYYTYIVCVQYNLVFLFFFYIRVRCEREWVELSVFVGENLLGVRVVSYRCFVAIDSCASRNRQIIE